MTKERAVIIEALELVSVVSKLPSMMLLVRLRDTVDNFLREEDCALGKRKDTLTKFSLLD